MIRILVIVLAALAVAAGILALCVGGTVYSLRRELSVIKTTAGDLAAAIQQMDAEELYACSDQLSESTEKLQNKLKDPLLTFAPKLVKRGGDLAHDLTEAKGAVYLMDEINRELFRPLAKLFQEYPLSGLKKGDDMDVDILQAYVEFFETCRPEVRKVLAEAESLHFQYLDLASYETLIAQDADSARALLAVLGEAERTVIKPTIKVLRQNPLSLLRKTEQGLNVGILLSYLNLLDRIEPKVSRISGKLAGIRFQSVSIDLQQYLEDALFLFHDLDKLSDYRDLIRMFLGDGEDRLYLVMAQNTAEIRASGGFPGAMGVVRIKNGILSMGDFSSVLNFLKMTNVAEADITYTEQLLFQYMYSRYSHDACYNPHFSKVAKITKVAYEVKNEETVDGVIAVTPEIIQKILALTGQEIELEDGTVLTGENATRIIQRDLYYRYQGDNATAVDNNSYIDNLFAETAKTAIGLLFRSISMESISDYLEFLGTCGENRMMLLWFADEKAEELAEKNHCSGNLNSDPKQPTAGVYFSCCDPGKLGMFTAISTTVSPPRIGPDLNREYTVRVTFNNYINTEDVTDINSWYLLGSNNKAIQSYAYFFAPAGGTVSDFKVSNGMTVRQNTYEDLQVGYLINLYLYPGRPVSVTYKVTTAHGIMAPLQIDQTPTLQNYR